MNQSGRRAQAIKRFRRLARRLCVFVSLCETHFLACLGHASAPATHTGADVHVTPSGRHAYVTNRGQSNTLARYAVTADGDLTLLGHESTRGETPRNFTIEPAGELLLVGNQDSQNVAIFRIDEASGALTHLETTDVGVSPFFVALWRFEP